MRAALLLPLLLTAAGCGQDQAAPPSTDQIRQLATPKVERIEDRMRLDPLTFAELEQAGVTGAGCDFSVGDRVLLAATMGGAVVKYNGAIVRLRQSGPLGEMGGFFESQALTASIGRTQGAGTTGGESISRPARVKITDRRAGEARELAGIWSCGA